MENEIKKQLDAYEIKLTSNKILNAYYAQEKKVERKKFPFFKILIPTFAFASLVLVTIPLLNRKPSSTNVPSSYEDQTAFSIFSAVNLLENKQDAKLKLKKARITENEFNDVVTTFDTSYELISSLLNKSEQELYSVEIKTFENDNLYNGKYNQYAYLLNLEIDNIAYKFYTNMSFEEDEEEEETSFIGELYLDSETIYRCEIEIEKELNEKEIELKVFYDNNYYLSIEHEVENKEIEYTYSLVNGDKIELKQSLSFENIKDKKTKCEFEVVSNNKYFQYKKIHLINENVLDVSYKYLDTNSKFTLEVIENEHIYTDEKNNFKKIL